jgi:predicted dehydrogenase
MTKKVKTIYNAIIIGCGSIGTTKDNKYDDPEKNDNILTIAHAFHNHPQIKLIGVIDSDPVKAKQAGDKWNCPWFESLENLWNRFTPVPLLT